MTVARVVTAEQMPKIHEGRQQEDRGEKICDVSLPALAQEISKKAAVSPHATMAVLDALMHILPVHAAHDQVVRFGNVTVSSQRQPTPGGETAERLAWRTFNEPLGEPAWRHWLRQIRTS